MKPKIKLFLAVTVLSLLIIFNFSSVAQAQNDKKPAPTLTSATPPKAEPKFKMSTYVITNYSISLNKKDDVSTGKRYVKDSGVVNNSFALQYVRLNFKYEINDRTEATVLANFKELSGSSFQKVLEIAMIKYKISKDEYLNFQVGQFRPFTNVEDMFSVTSNKSFGWSNQYNALSASNWDSFQMGAALFGSLKKSNVPLNYYVTVWNGNGRSSVPYNSDNDNSKNIALRLEYDLFKNATLGSHIASTKYLSKSVQSFSVDWRSKHKLGKKTDLELEGSYYDGHDISSISAVAKSLSAANALNYGNFKMNGFYAVPLIRYNINKPYFQSISFSLRYENWNQNMTNGTVLNGVTTDGSVKNRRQTYLPLISLNFAEKYGSRIDFFGIFNSYSHNLEPVKGKENIYNNNSQIGIKFQFSF